MNERTEHERDERPTETIPDLEVDDEVAERVRGGAPPSPPAGPIPIPYPTVLPKK